MIKRPTFNNPKEYLIARDGDRMSYFTLCNAQIRGAYVQANLVVKEMATNHSLGPYETYLLGQGYVAGLLLSSNLKDDDQINIRVNTDGPARGLSVDTNARGEVRGYLFQNPLAVPEGTNTLSLAQAMGSGTLSVTRFLEHGRTPVTGTVTYEAGNFADSLVHYFDQSEQIATAIDISLNFDKAGNCLGAGGLLLQALPGCPDILWNQAAQRLKQIPSIGENAASNHSPQALLSFWFSEWEPQWLRSQRVEFFCPCSRERFESFLKRLPHQDKKDILTQGPFPLETVCHNCASTYAFQKEELQLLFTEDKTHGS